MPQRPPNRLTPSSNPKLRKLLESSFRCRQCGRCCSPLNLTGKKTEPSEDPNKCKDLHWVDSKGGRKYFCGSYGERDAQCRLFPLAEFPPELIHCPASEELVKKIKNSLKENK